MEKIYKPGECMKYMDIEVHPTLLETWYCADLIREVAATGAKVVPSPDIYDPALVMWSRTVQSTLVNNNGEVELSPRKKSCGRALYITCADDVAEHVANHTLARHVGQIKDTLGHAVTLVVFGDKDYFKKSGRKTQNSSKKLMTKIDFEMAKVDMLVSVGCDIVAVNTPNELALLIVQFTKAIAEEPYKQAKREADEQADFYMRGDNRKCVAIDKDGNGVSRLWQQMVAILPMSSLETSIALCAQYKSPRELYEAMQAADSVATLADIKVSRAAVPGARARRLGPELARKLHALFTAHDGHVLLD